MAEVNFSRILKERVSELSSMRGSVLGRNERTAKSQQAQINVVKTNSLDVNVHVGHKIPAPVRAPAPARNIVSN